MDGSAPSDRKIPHSIGVYKNNSDWYIRQYTWQEYESNVAGDPISIEDVLTTGVKATHAYYVYIRVVALDNSGVSQSRQPMTLYALNSILLY